MSKKVSRVVGERHGATVANDFPDPADDEFPAGSKEPEDPALLAASRMLADAFDLPSGAADAAARAGAVVVIRAPSAVWSSYLLRALPGVLARTLFAKMSVPERPGGAPDSWSLRSRGLPTWRLGTDFQHARERVEDLEEHVWSGHGAVGVAHDFAFLPPVLLESADVVLEVAEPGAGVLLAASAVCSDGPSEWPWGEPAVTPTPGMLRSAFRNGAPVSDCHARMKKALDGKASKERPAKAGDGWTLDRLRGQSEFAAFGHALASDLRSWKAGELAWSEVSPGCVLVGPPGTGKTSAAKALAGSCGTGVGFVASSYAAWCSVGRGYQTDIIKGMRESFDAAKKKAPCILFIDELDSVVGRNQSQEHDDYWRAIVNAMLECLDGVAGREGVVVVGAANDISGIDAAVLRSGRLDRTIQVGLPDAAALAEILADHLGAGWHAADLGRPARLLIGRSGADAARAVREARQSARQAKRPVTIDDVVSACQGAPRDPSELRETALHEAAHAVVSEILMPSSVNFVSLANVDGRLGGCAVRGDAGNLGASGIEARVTALLAGRAAEELLLGGPQAGCGGPAESDLGLATGILLRARLCQGLYGEAAWRGDVGPAEVAAILRSRPDLHKWIEVKLAEMQDAAVGILAQHETTLLAVAGMLTENTVLSGDDVRGLMMSTENTGRMPR